MLVLAAFAGGSSRADSLAQAVVRGGEAALLTVLLTMARPVESRSVRLPLMFLTVVTTVLAAMLVPLPPALWTVLPGRELIAQAAPLAGVPQPWRPFAMVPPLGWNALYSLIPPAAVLIAMVYLTPRQRVRLVWPVAGVIVASAVLGVAQLGAGPDSALRWYANQGLDSGVGFFSNRNHQALLLAMGFPVLALWSGSRALPVLTPAMRMGLATAGGLVIAIALPATGSRAGLLLGALGLVAVVVIRGRAIARAVRAMPARARFGALAILAALLAAVVAVTVFSPQARALTRLFTLDVTQDLRAMAWPTLRRLVAAYMPAGTGFGGFERVFRAGEPFDMLKLTYFNAAHNDYVQVAIEGGVVGVALIAAFVGWWLLQGVRLARGRAECDATTRAAGVTGWIMVLLILGASAFDYPMRTPLIMVMMVVACAWIALPDAAGQRANALRSQEPAL